MQYSTATKVLGADDEGRKGGSLAPTIVAGAAKAVATAAGAGEVGEGCTGRSLWHVPEHASTRCTPTSAVTLVLVCNEKFTHTNHIQ